jgi:hypothetical protein
MSNVQSYNALIDRFKAFASGHFILKRFSHGQIEVSDLEKFGEYPFMHVVPSNVTYAKGMKTFSFQIVLADMPRDKEEKPEYQREVLSDLQRIAEDLIAEITNHRVLFGDLITVQNVSLEPFLEEFQHTLTGWTISLDLLVPYYWDACSIPAEWNDFFESSTGGTGSILTFIDSITRDENGNVSLVNDEATPAPNYYYGTNNEGVRGWYLLTDEVGLTCETIGDCQTIIDIEQSITNVEDDVNTLQTEIGLKANSADLGATAFSNNYNDLDNLPTLTNGTVTSVGLTMPSAFSVANSPITSSGDLAVTGAGTVSQYVRGDGSLANFPSSTGGGASLSFYLNGSVAQGTFGGISFKEMDRTPVLGVGTDFTIATNGYIQSFITDANVPNQLEIPAGNWNFETYFSSSSNGGTPSFYIELYKWDGATLSLIASNSATPEGITNGTVTDLYVSALAIPQTTLALTDRLAVRIYVNNSGRTIKLHTENSHLCQVITTFSTGLTALNGLTAQVQNFATGTSGTDFGISSATSTHTFNLPTASAANRGALSSADWTTFNSKVPSTRSLTINGTTQDLSADRTFTIATGLTVGTTPITSGTVGRVLFEGTGNVLQEDAGLSWDNTNKRLSLVSTGDNLLNLTPQASGNAIVFNNNSYIKWGTIGYTRGFSTATTFAVYNSAFTNIFNIGTTAACYVNTGSNFLIGTTTDAGYKLDVNGTARVVGQTTLSGVGNTSATVALTTQNSDAVAMFAVRNDGAIRLNSISTGTTIFPYASDENTLAIGGRNIAFSSAITTQGSRGVIAISGVSFTATIGSSISFGIYKGFAPTSGTGTFEFTRIEGTINQTGGANGITRGLYINPTLTAVADFRAIEVARGITILGAATTAKASLRIPSGTAPTSPVDGDIWFDGTNIQMRIGGVTKTFTLL